jgi:hypothetical protein
LYKYAGYAKPESASWQVVCGCNDAIIDAKGTGKVALAAMDFLVLSSAQFVGDLGALRFPHQIKQRTGVAEGVHFLHHKPPVGVVLSYRC